VVRSVSLSQCESLAAAALSTSDVAAIHDLLNSPNNAAK
jgi:hypothetical protein